MFNISCKVFCVYHKVSASGVTSLKWHPSEDRRHLVANGCEQKQFLFDDIFDDSENDEVTFQRTIVSATEELEHGMLYSD